MCYVRITESHRAIGGNSLFHYGKEYRLSCYSLMKEKLVAYAEVLKNAGFTSDVSEKSDGTLYRFEGSNETGEVTVQVRLGETVNPEVFLTEAFATINK